MNKLLLLTAVFALAMTQATVENMNGEYTISNPNPTKGGHYNTQHSTRTKTYFDVYTPPIRTRYGEVFWTMMDPVPLPQEILDKFQDSSMAIVGYEAD